MYEVPRKYAPVNRCLTRAAGLRCRAKPWSNENIGHILPVRRVPIVGSEIASDLEVRPTTRTCVRHFLVDWRLQPIRNLSGDGSTSFPMVYDFTGSMKARQT